MTRPRRLWELLELGRGLVDFTELTLLAGGSLLLEAAHRVPSLNSVLQLRSDDSIEQLPERLRAQPRYQLLAEHMTTVLARPGVDKVLGQLRYVTSQILNDIPQEEVWPASGQMFGELLGRADTMRSGFYTLPDTGADLVVSPLRLTAGMQVFDPTAHSGQLLIAVGRKLRAQGVAPEEVTLLGQEAFPFAAAMGQLNLLLNQLPQATLVAGDLLTDESYPLGQYDVVISIPPFNADRVLELERDPRFYRNRKGGRIKSESAYLQAGLAAVKPGGQATFLMPASVLFTGFYAQLREAFAHEGIITAAVHLAPGLLAGTAVTAALLVFDLPDRGEAKSSSLRLVEAENIGEKGRMQRVLTPETVSLIMDGIRGQEGEAVQVCEVTLAEQIEKDFIWLSSAYQQQELHMVSLSATQQLIPAAVQQAQDTEKQVADAMANLQQVLEASRTAK